MKNSRSSLYNDLKRQILTMELDPDEMLDEVAISERYGRAPTAVREILQHLAGGGHADISEKRGAGVIPMSHPTLRSLFLLVPNIFAAIDRVVVRNFKSRQLVDLKEIQQRFRGAVSLRHARVMVEQKNRFHKCLLLRQ